MIVIDIKTDFINDDMYLPEYAHKTDAAVDLQANINKPIILSYGEQKLIPTGISVGLPGTPDEDFNWVLDIVPRSGLANKHGLTITNSPGKIDSSFRGMIHIIVRNTKKDAFLITPGMRLAQMQLSKAYKISWNEVDSLDETERGQGGFGSTGHD